MCTRLESGGITIERQAAQQDTDNERGGASPS